MDLHDKTILTTRSKAQSHDLRTRLEALGARVLEFPSIEIVPPESWAPADEAIARISSYDWLLFTSANAVEHFMQRAGPVESVKIAAVGSSTARKLKEWNLEVSLVPADFRAEGLLQCFPARLDGVRILFPRAETAREVLPEALRGRGAVVDVVAVYRTVRPEQGGGLLEHWLSSEKIDCIVFTSPSTVRNLGESLKTGDLVSALGGIAVAVIGPVTREAAQSFGLSVEIEAPQATIPALVGAIHNHFNTPRVHH